MTDNNTLPAILHRIRTGTTTADDAGRVHDMIRAAHDWGRYNGDVLCDDSWADLLAWLEKEDREEQTPQVPGAIETDEGISPVSDPDAAYARGWNDCRTAVLAAQKTGKEND